MGLHSIILPSLDIISNFDFTPLILELGFLIPLKVKLTLSLLSSYSSLPQFNHVDFLIHPLSNLIHFFFPLH